MFGMPIFTPRLELFRTREEKWFSAWITSPLPFPVITNRKEAEEEEEKEEEEERNFFPRIFSAECSSFHPFSVTKFLLLGLHQE